jgi:hypothetical protein
MVAADLSGKPVWVDGLRRIVCQMSREMATSWMQPTCIEAAIRTAQIAEETSKIVVRCAGTHWI